MSVDLAVDSGSRHGRPRTSRHVPAIDGLRALAVAAVLVYHGGYPWMPGGFLGVSTFFTLSGFLITGLLLEELRRNDRVSIGGFLARRSRRLLPAAIATLVAVLALHRWFDAVPPQQLRNGVLAALGYVENWWLIHSHQAYGALFTDGSPVQHFWSLAIEEQYYLVFPIVLMGLFRLFARRRYVGAALVAALAVSVAIAATSSDATRTYYATDTRAAEILVGILLAFVAAPAGRLIFDRPARRAMNALGVVGIVGLAMLWTSVELHDGWLFPGGVLLNAGCTAAVIVACSQQGALARVLSARPLVALGAISYGTYLLHWPIFMLLTPARLGLERTPTFVVRVAVTLTAAAVMFMLFENPIRRGRLLRGRAFPCAVALGAALVVVMALSLPNDSASAAVDFGSAPTVSGQLKDLSHVPTNGDRRILVVGDSFSFSVLGGLQDWGRARHIQVELYSAVGCGSGGPGTIDYLGLTQSTYPGCGDWIRHMADAVRVFHPDVVLVAVGLADVSPRRLADGRFHSIGTRAFDARLRARVRSIARALAVTGASVRWATYPHVAVEYRPGSTGTPPFVENQPRRMDRLNRLVTASVRDLPHVSMVDLARYCRSRPGGEFDPAFRTDGVHLGPAGSQEVARWLGPRLAA